MTDHPDTQLFHEMNGRYYALISLLTERASTAPLSRDEVLRLLTEKGFAETAPTLGPLLLDGEWPLLADKGGMYHPIVKPLSRPLSMLERRWIAAILDDPRISLFMDDDDITSVKEYVNADPMYDQAVFHTTDASGAPDPFDDNNYRKFFRIILEGIRNGRPIKARYCAKNGNTSNMVLLPRYLQYSRKDDKFRLIALRAALDGTVRRATLNLDRFIDARKYNKPVCFDGFEDTITGWTAVLELSSERNALERALIHFASFECEAYMDGCIKLEINYDEGDELELLIRILAFGPLVRVREPQRLVDLIRERVARQRELFAAEGQDLI